MLRGGGDGSLFSHSKSTLNCCNEKYYLKGCDNSAVLVLNCVSN